MKTQASSASTAVAALPVPMAQMRLVGDDQARRRPRRPGPRARRAPAPPGRASVCPASRCSSVSPTQTIGVMPWRRTARSVAATVASSIPKSVRRSECPTITYDVASRARKRGLTSPVRAPASSSEQCCAPSATGMCSFSTSVCTVRRSVKGGWTDTSTRATSSGLSRRPRSRTVCSASMWSWCIFQFPLTSGRRRASPPRRVGRLAQGVDARAGAPPVSMKRQRRPATGREEVDLVAPGRAPRARWRCHRRPTTEKPGQSATASATTRVPAAKRWSSKAPSGPFHSTVPAPRDDLGEGRRRVRADVEAGPAVGQVALDHLDAPPRPVSRRGRPERAARLQGPGVGREQDVARPSPGAPGSPRGADSSSSELPTCCPRAARKV